MVIVANASNICRISHHIVLTEYTLECVLLQSALLMQEADTKLPHMNVLSFPAQLSKEFVYHSFVIKHILCERNVSKYKCHLSVMRNYFVHHTCCL
jgi:hypothetical protein